MGLHEPHAGKSYLGREAVNRLGVAGLDAHNYHSDADDCENYECYSAFHSVRTG